MVPRMRLVCIEKRQGGAGPGVFMGTHPGPRRRRPFCLPPCRTRLLRVPDVICFSSVLPHQTVRTVFPFTAYDQAGVTVVIGGLGIGAWD
jgi:methyl coenzyme M reductase beta subunit